MLMRGCFWKCQLLVVVVLASCLLAQGQTAGGKFLELSLERIPTPSDRLALQRHGVLLHEYLRHEGSASVYWAEVSGGTLEMMRERGETDLAAVLSSCSTRGGMRLWVAEVKTRWQQKVATSILCGDIPEYALAGEGRVHVVVSLRHGGSREALEARAVELGLRQLEGGDLLPYVYAELWLERLEALASVPWVGYVALVDPPQKLSNELGSTMNGGRALSAGLALPGVKLSGLGVRVGIWDGILERHADFGDRVTFSGPGERSSHGQHVAGTVGGSGTLDSLARGVAPGVRLYSYDFQINDIPGDMAKSRERYGIDITQNSYGAAVEKKDCTNDAERKYKTGYRASSAQLDALSLKYPKMAHFYAAGNEQENCTNKYNMSTRTAKNVVSVAAVDAAEQMSTFSSWGPTSDGRLVPHVAAYGVGVYSTVYGNSYDKKQGTSMATPSVSGLSSLLYELYNRKNGGDNPDFILIKNALMNTARDRGNPGPDYKFGYGVVDGELAAALLNEHRYALADIKQGETNTHSIEVPAGTRALRVMIAWHDAPGQPESSSVLVNDLDLRVGEAMPYVLDPLSPSAPAVRGNDSKNNQEQVIIDNPSPGVYTATVSAANVPSDRVRYSITWVFDTDSEFRVVYPKGGEQIELLYSSAVRWRGAKPGVHLNIYLEVNGSEYPIQTVSNPPAVGGVLLQQYGNNPEMISKNARIVIRQGGSEAKSPAPFTLMARPYDFKVTGERCGKRVLLEWSAPSRSASYNVYAVDRITGATELVKEGIKYPSHTIEDITPFLGKMLGVSMVVNGVEGARSELVQPDVQLPMKVEDGVRILLANPSPYRFLHYNRQFMDVSVERADGALAVAPYDGYWNAYDTSPQEFSTNIDVCLDLSAVTAAQQPVIAIPIALHQSSGSSVAEAKLVHVSTGEVLKTNGNALKITATQGEDFTFDLSRYAGQPMCQLSLQVALRGRQKTNEIADNALILPFSLGLRGKAMAPSSRVELQLVDGENDRPLMAKGVEVTLHRDGASEASYRMRSDAAGRVVFGDVVLGNYVVRVPAPLRGYLRFESSAVEVKIDGLRSDVRLLRDASVERVGVSYEVLNSSSNPAVGVVVLLTQGAYSLVGVSNAGGLVDFGEIPTGSYTLSIVQMPEEYSLYTRALDIGSAVNRERIVLQRGDASGVGSDCLSRVRALPNPFGNWLMLQGVDGAVRVEAYSLTGVRVFMQALDGQEVVTLDVSGWHQGVYLLRVVGRDSVKVLRVVKH